MRPMSDAWRKYFIQIITATLSSISSEMFQSIDKRQGVNRYTSIRKSSIRYSKWNFLIFDLFR